MFHLAVEVRRLFFHHISVTFYYLDSLRWLGGEWGFLGLLDSLIKLPVGKESLPRDTDLISQFFLRHFVDLTKFDKKSAVGGAAGVIHQVDSPTTDCQPNSNVEALRVFLLGKKIEARPVWKPMHKQPVYADCPAYVNGVSEDIFKVGMCLPAGPMVSDEDIEYIIQSIKEAIQ